MHPIFLESIGILKDRMAVKYGRQYSRIDPSNEDHMALARLGEECTKKVSKLLSKGISTKSIGNLRKIIKAELEDEIKEIDRIVRGIMKL